MNFRYRHNLRVYLEQFAGRGYADIVLVPRGKDRSLNAIPIIIEMKAATKAELEEGKIGEKSGTAPTTALKQAEDYTKGFQPNVMRILTTANDMLCVGVNLDHPSPVSNIVAKSRDQGITPLFDDIMESIDKQDNGEITQEQLKTQIQENIERIYHTFPGTGEKGDNHYFSRFLLGQSLLLNEALEVSFKKHVFIYGENIPTEAQPEPKSQRLKDQKSKGQGAGQPSNLDQSHGVVTMVFIPSNDQKSVYVMNIVETDGRDNAMNKGIPLDQLQQEIGNRKIVELNLSFNIKKKSKFEEYFSVEVGESVSLEQYNRRETNKFEGNFKDIPYPTEFKETFDKVLESQLASSQDRSQSIGKYKESFEKLGEAMLPFKDLIEKEAHTQAVFHGVFSHYSDIKLGELQENRALVLTEFQTGRGKRIDMLVHGIKFADQASSAREYDPVGLELKGPREDKTVNALKDEANKQITDEYKKGVTYKTLTDGKKVAFMGVVFDKGANSPDSLILPSKNEFTSVEVVHSSIFSFSQQQCSKGRKQRSTGITCIDSFDEEKITKEEKEKLIKELFGIEAHDTKIITIDSPQVRVDNDKVNIEFKNNNGNNKKLVIDNATSIKSIENYILDKENLEIKLKVSSDKEYAIIEEVKGQDSEYYLKIDDYRIKLDSILEGGKGVIFDKLHQLSNDKQVLENKKYIEDIGDVQTNQDYNNIVEEIKQNLLAKGVREDTFNRFKSHFDNLGEKVFADYISNVEKNLNEKGIAFDRDKFDSAKIKGAKGGKFFSMMAIYDLLDSISDTATLGRHDNDALKQVFGINGILDAMDDVRESISTHYISSNGRIVTKIPRDKVIGKVVSKIPDSIRKDFVKIISNPVVQSITFATIAYQFGYSINEIAQGNHHPLNYYWTASSSVKLASMSIRPISTGVSFTVKSVSATTKILRGLSAAGKVLGRASVVTMVADVLITMGVEIYERIEYTKAIAEQVPLLPGGEQAEVFFAGVIKFFTGRDVEKEYEDTIRIKGYLNHIKEVAIRLLDDNYNVAAVVQYVVSIEEKYSEVIKSLGTRPICKRQIFLSCRGMVKEECGLEKRYDNISFGEIDLASNVKRDLSSLDVSKTLPMIPYTLVMSEAWEKFICDVSGIVQDNSQCYRGIDGKKVYIVNTDAKHIPHLTKHEYENLGLRIVDAPLGHPMQRNQCNKINEVSRGYGSTYGLHFPCNTGKIHEKCQETFTLSGEPFIFTNPKRKDLGNTKKQTFPKGSVLYLSGPRTLTAAANNPAVMHIPQGSNIHYIGSKNNETIFIINNSTSGTLEGGVGKENTVVMNVIADNIIADLHDGMLSYGNSNNIRLVNTYNYVSNSDNLQSITTNCKTTLINVKNAEVWQNSLNCTDKDYEFRVVNKANVHHRGLKRTIFVVNEDSDKAKIVSDLGSTEKIKENIDIIRVEVDDITKWRISEDINKIDYNLDFLSNDTQNIVSSTRIDNFRNLIVQVNCSGIVESVTIQDKSLSDTVEDIRYQKLRNSGNDISSEVIQNSEKKLKALIQASILDQELPNTYQLAKNIASKSNVDIPIYQVEVIKNHMGIPTEKVIIAGMYSDQVVVDFGYNNSDVTSSYQKYLNNGQGYGYDDYVMQCNYYQDITIEGEKGQHRYVIKLPDTLNSKIPSSPIRVNLKIKNKAAPMPYSIIDFAKLNVIDVNSIVIKKGERSYINECYNKSISDLTEDSLEIQDITIFDSKGTKWSLSIGLVDYLQSLEHQQIVLQINNQLYKIDSTNLELEHNPNSFRYYQPGEQGLQIYHNQPINKNDIGLVDLKDKSILDFDTKIVDDSLVLLHKGNTLVKIENWNTYQPAREMKFAFNDTTVANADSACNSKDIIEDFDKEKITLLREKMFDAIVRNNANEANDLIRKIEIIEGKSGLTPLYIAIQAGRLDIVKTLCDRKHSSVQGKDVYPLHLAAQEGKLNIAKFLVNRGIDTGTQDNDGRTPLRIAAYNGNLDVVKFFLDRNTGIEVKNNDPHQMMKIVKSVKKEIINQAETTPNVKRWAEFFVEKLRYSIKNVAQEKLKDDMLHDRYSSFNNLADEIYNSDGKLFDDIIKKVINEVYGKVDTKKILSFVRDHGYIAQLISGYIAVFDAMQENDDLNNGAVLKLAYYVKEAMENYPNVHQEERSNLEKLKGRLPESVRNAVFASQVCITNVRFKEYIYSVDSLSDQNRRIVRTWVPSSRSDPPGSCSNDEQGVWKIQPHGDYFCITNVRFNEYLYSVDSLSDQDRRIVHTWVPSSSSNPPGSCGDDNQGLWKIQPYGDYVCITNVRFNEYLYSVDSLSDQDRRIVHTWVPSSSSNPPGSCGDDNQGMWRIKDCGSNVRKVRSQGAVTSARDNNGGAFTDGSFNQSITEPPVCDVSVNSYFGENIDINSVGENGLTRIHSAAWKGQVDDARLLIEKGAYIDAEDVFGRKPIHVAAENNNKNIIEFFLSKGVSIDDADRYGRTPLYYASGNGNLDIVKCLVEKGADINAQDKGGKTSLDAAIDKKYDNVEKYLKQVQLDKELLIVAQYGNLDEVRDLVSKGANINAKDKDGKTPLHLAAQGNSTNIIQLLLDMKVSSTSVDVEDDAQRTPLYCAAESGNLNAVNLFLDRGANINNRNTISGATLLHAAVKSNKPKVIKIFLDRGISIESKDIFDTTPMLLAVRLGKLDAVKFLLENGANIEAQDRNGWTYILHAAKKIKWDVVKLLINKGAKFNNETTFQGTPLHFAVQEGNLDMVRFLLDKGADIESQNAYNEKPLHLAVKVGRLDILKLLLDRGANINATNMDGQTPSDLATQKGYSSIVEILRQAQLNLDKELLIAAEKGDIEKVRGSIRQGANVNVKGKQGWTPVFWAIQKNNFNIVELLLNNSADVKVKDNEGWTSLHWAVELGELNVVELLVERGADVNALTADYRTPYDFAINQNYREIKKYLRSNSAVPSSMLIPHVILADDSVRQRKRRHHHGDHARHHMSRKLLAIDSSNQPEIVASSSTRPSSWINGLLGWVKSSVSGLVSSVADKFAAEESENSKLGDTGPCSAGLEKMYSATILQSRKSLDAPKGNIPNRSWSSNQEKVRSNVTVVPEINTAVVDSALILGDLAVRLVNGRRHKQPIHENLLSPREQSMRFIDEDMIIRAIQQGKEKFGVPGTKMDEVEIIGNKTEIGK
ncbi:MAG: ankyrin repeat domain-containing protein [Wolbachia pipientis]